MAQVRVVVIDSKPSTGAKICSALANTSVELLMASSFADVEAHLIEGPVAVFYCAAALTDESGYNVAKKIRALCPEASIFLLAGGFEVYDEARAVESGVTACLPRPLSRASIVASLSAALGPNRLADASDLPPAPLLAEERWARFVPSAVDGAAESSFEADDVRSALEALVVELLPEVVEGVVRHTLGRSSKLRDLVAAAVEQEVRALLPSIASRVGEESEKNGSSGSPPA